MSKKCENVEELDDTALAYLVKFENNEEALGALISRHTGLCFSIAKKYISHPNITGVNRDEILCSKDKIIYESAKTYDKDKARGAKFSTWLGNCMKYHCLDTIYGNIRTTSVDEDTLNFLVESRARDSEDKSLQKNGETLEYIKEILSQIGDSSVRRVIELRYFSNQDKMLTFAEISKKMNASIQTTVNWHDKFIKLIRTKIVGEKALDIV